MALTKLSQARARMLLRHPFFATLLLSTPNKETRDVPTAGTDGKTLFWNPDFMEGLSLEETQGVMAHEVLHMALEHCLRRWRRHPFLWNIACDFAINLTLKDCGFTLPAGACLDEKYRGMSADAIYEHLQKEMEKQGKGKGKGKGDKDGPGGGFPGLSQDTMHGDVMEPPEMTEAERVKAEREMRQKVAQAANMARMAGKMTAPLEELVGKLLNPVVPWQALLRDYMTRVTHDDESWSRRNRRFSDVFLPARHSEGMGKIVVIRDVSGSISHEEQCMTVAEVESIAQQTRPECIHVVAADTEVKLEEIFQEGEKVEIKPVVGGGTDMRVPLAYADTLQPEVVVLITDGYTPWPDSEPMYPLIVLCTTNQTVPVGQVVRINV